MRNRLTLVPAIICIAWSAVAQVSLTTQQKSGPHQVIVDALVMDKKGNYLPGLSTKDFRIVESGNDQSLLSIAKGTASSEPEYVVLIFDQMQVEDQTIARGNSLWLAQIGANANRNFAVVTYLGNGAMKLEQGFTNDRELLVEKIKGIKASGIYIENQPVQMIKRQPRLDADALKNQAPESDSPIRFASSSHEFVGRSLLWSLESLAKSLAKLPGHKSIVFFTPGMTLEKNEQDILTSLIETCNKSNVTVYPLQVRINEALQQPLRTLSTGTGGFAMLGNNEFESGLRSVIEDGTQRYLITYASPNISTCHPIEVKVSHEGAVVRARKQFCEIQGNDPLAGTEIGRELETRIAGTDTGTLRAHLHAPFFYTGPNSARVDVSAEVSSGELKFVKQRGRFHSSLNVLGVAYRSDGSVAARFSDAIDFDFNTKEEVEHFKQSPYQYQNQFEAPSGRYTLKVAFSPESGAFGIAESRLSVAAFDERLMGLSGVALSKEFGNASDTQRANLALAARRVPLISKGVQFIPVGNPLFKKSDPASVYFEVYEAKTAAADAPPLLVQLRVMDLNSATVKIDSGMISTASWKQPGKTVIPVALKLAIASLPSGDYRVDVRLLDSKGLATPWRSAEFTLE